MVVSGEGTPQKGRGERPRRDLPAEEMAPLGESKKVVGDVHAVRAIASDATPRPYSLASIATSAGFNNAANSGYSLVSHACLTQDLARLRDPYGQGSRASGHLEWVARLPLLPGQAGGGDPRSRPA